MSPTAMALRTGWSRGLIELRQSFTNPAELWGHFFWPTLMLAAMYFMRDASFRSSGFLLGTLALPSVLGMNVALGMVSMSQQLTAGLFLIDGLLLGRGSWMTLAWVLVLGMVATLPIGAILGSVFSSARAQALLQLPIMGMIAISGIFYPITALPEWLQWIAQLSPIYWLGLGMRSALLPEAAVGVELGESWRHLETVGVLGVWAVFGLVVAPLVLRRMARRESGSRVAERRERALQRVG